MRDCQEVVLCLPLLAAPGCSWLLLQALDSMSGSGVGSGLELLNMRRFAYFTAPLSNGGTARWRAEVVRITDGIAYVRHPEHARRFPFSPVAQPGLYKYRADCLNIQEAATDER